MKSRVLILFILAGLFIGSGAGMIWFKMNVYEKNKQQVAVKDPYCAQERYIAVIVNGGQDEASFRSVLESALTQKYSHFRVYAVTDAGEKIARNLPRKHHLTIVERDGKVFEENLYTLVHELPDHTLVLVLDAEEKMVSATALSSLNKYYSGSDVWCTYGQTTAALSQTYSKGEITEEEQTLHKLGPCVSFLASVYKKIPLGEMLRGLDFSARGYVRPLVAVAGEHVYHINEPLFEGEPYSDIQYFKIGKLEVTDPVERAQCDFVVFSYNRPLQLMALLESSKKNLRGLGDTFVLYRADDEYEEAYTKLETMFPLVTFVKQSKEKPKEDFKQKLLDIAFSGRYSRGSHIVFGVDDIIVKGTVDVKKATELLERTHAHGVFLRLGKNIDYCYMLNKSQPVPRSKKLETGAFAYKFADGEADWRYPNTVDMTLYKKADIQAALESLPYANPAELEAKWDDSSAFDYLGRQDGGKEPNKALMGIFYETSKIVNIPLNVVSEVYANVNKSMQEYSPKDLLEFFEKGYKIDIEKIKNVENHSCHAELDLDFIKNDLLLEE